MPQTPAEPASNFAGLLAALTTPKASKPIFPLDDIDADPEPDISTLTYDRALRAHARYRPNQIPNAATKAASDAPVAGTLPRTAPNKLEQTRKRASITVRLTQSEYAQLQQRATEAGLTVSAYLRSCTFEVESLRAQVKQALTELRSTHPATPQARQRMFSRFFSH